MCCEYKKNVALANKLKVATKLKVYNFTVKSALIYGYEAWLLTGNQKETLDVHK